MKKQKNYAKNLKKGVKALSKTYKKYAPKVAKAGRIVQHHSKAISESTMDMMVPKRTRTHVDMTARRKPTRVAKTKQGFYLDYTQ